MATALTGDKVTVSVKNTFLDFAENCDEGESDTLRRCSSEGSLSRKSTSSSSNTCHKTYTWITLSDVGSTEEALETVVQSSSASCPKHQTGWWASTDGSTGDATETMSQSSFASCRSSSQFSGSNRSAPRQSWEIPDASSSSSGMDAPLPLLSDLVKALLPECGMTAEDLQKLDSEGILEKIPRNEDGGITSIGSLNHSLGTCSPCIFWFRSFCVKSLRCTHCHFRHQGQKMRRHKPNKRHRQLLRESKLINSEESINE